MRIQPSPPMLRHLLFAFVLGAVALGSFGCGDALDTVDGDGAAPVLVSTELRAILRGSQEVPSVTTLASGTATGILSADRTSLRVTLQTQGLTNVAAAHIHVGATGENGPIILPLYDAATDGAFPSTLIRELTAADLQPQPIQGIAAFGDAVNAILAGRTYVNVHTQQNPGGEIRGQLGPVSLRATLRGDNEVPPVTTPATGTADVALNATQTQVLVTLRTAGLQNVMAAHIHVGPPGENGPIILPLYDAATDGAFPAILSRALVATDLQAHPAAGIITLEDAVNAILSGNAYVNVHTQQNPGGEIRGQIAP